MFEDKFVFPLTRAVVEEKNARRMAQDDNIAIETVATLAGQIRSRVMQNTLQQRFLNPVPESAESFIVALGLQLVIDDGVNTQLGN